MDCNMRMLSGQVVGQIEKNTTSPNIHPGQFGQNPVEQQERQDQKNLKNSTQPKDQRQSPQEGIKGAGQVLQHPWTGARQNGNPQ